MLRVGRRAQQGGQILDSDRTDVFMPYDPICFSIGAEQVSGGAVRISIQNQKRQGVWQDQKNVEAGDAFVTFQLGPGTLPPDDYVAVLSVGNRSLAEHAFKVSSQ